MVKAVSQYQTVLKVKQHQEKVAQLQLKQIEDVHLREKETLQRLNERRDEAVEGTSYAGRARATDLQTQRAFVFKLTRQISNQSSRIEEIRIKEDAKRQELTEKAQSRQMVEKLHEKCKAEAAKDVERKEQNILDEIANRTSKQK
jgi:flagellar export protein FliJ